MNHRCPRGTYSVTNGSSTCEVCPVGHHTNGVEIGSTVCSQCERGRYSANNFTVECELCPQNLFTALNGSTSCEACPSGSVPNQEIGSWRCDPVAAGQFGSGSPCPMNTYSEAGAAECTTCPNGKYSSVSASQCITCDFMFRLSRRCEIPVTGIILVASTLITIIVLYILFERTYFF